MTRRISRGKLNLPKTYPNKETGNVRQQTGNPRRDPIHCASIISTININKEIINVSEQVANVNEQVSNLFPSPVGGDNKSRTQVNRVTLNFWGVGANSYTIGRLFDNGGSLLG